MVRRKKDGNRRTKFIEPNSEIRSLERENAELKEMGLRARKVGQIAMRDAMAAHTFAEALSYGAACAAAFLKAGHTTSAELVLSAIRSATVDDLRNRVAAEMAAIQGPE